MRVFGAAQALQDEATFARTDTDGEQWDREERAALRRVPGLSTELEDVTEVEYRQLRLENVVLVGVHPQGEQEDAENSLRELAALAETAGAVVLDGVLQRRPHPDPATYLGRGKAQELRDLVAALGADTVIADTELAPSQRRALEDVVKVKVIDRTTVILDIFSQHAKSREGKAQVELAQLEYLLPRLRGWGDSMSRQAGGQVGAGGAGMGSRGPGETKIELDRRRIRTKMALLRRQIRDFAPARDAKRAERKRNTIPSVAIAGYTNAGKSSLLNRLTSAGVLVENALFATLDATVRRAEASDGRVYTLTDTVGFVRNLPHQLVEAFRSTLEEVGDADVIVHVVDAAHPDPAAQLQTVRDVIGDVGARDITEIVVFNKADLVDDDTRMVLRGLEPRALFASSRTGEGIDELRAAIEAALPLPAVEVRALVPYDRGDLVSAAHESGTHRRRRRTRRAAPPLHAHVSRAPRRRARAVRGLARDSAQLERAAPRESRSRRPRPRNASSVSSACTTRLGAPEPVALALVLDVRVRDAVRGERVADRLGLRRRHDRVLRALQEQQRHPEPLRVRQRRPVDVQLPRPRAAARPGRRGSAPRSRECRRPARGRPRRRSGRCPRRTRRCATSAASTVHPPAEPPAMASRAGSARPLLGEARRGRGDVLDVDDAPLPAQALAVGPAVPAGSAVVDVEHADAAAGEVRDPPGCRAADGAPSARRGRSTRYGGRSPSGADDVGVGRREVERVDRAAAGPSKVTARGLRHPFGSPGRPVRRATSSRVARIDRRRRATGRRASRRRRRTAAPACPATSSMQTFDVTAQPGAVRAVPSCVDQRRPRRRRSCARRRRGRRPAARTSACRAPRADRRCRRRRERPGRRSRSAERRTRQRFQRPVGSSA